MKPIVSIVIPVFNCARYLNKCLDSVIAQTYTDWEAIVVDDGSTDNSVEILKLYAAKDNRIKIFRQPNSGVVTARNNALNNVIGEYLTFLDADDYLTINALEIMMNAIQHASADLCVGSYTLEWEETGCKTLVDHKKGFKTAIDCFRYCMKYGEMFLAIKLFRTEAYRRCVNIPKNVIIQEDVIGLTQYLKHSDSVTWVNESVYYYLKRPQSATGNFTPKHIDSLLTVSEFLLNNEFSKNEGEVYYHCAKIALQCIKSPLSSFDNQMRSKLILKSIPSHYIFKVRCKDVISNIKKFVKRLLKNSNLSMRYNR